MRANLDFNWNDLDKDGKIYLDELADLFLMLPSGGGVPGSCVFDASGAITPSSARTTMCGCLVVIALPSPNTICSASITPVSLRDWAKSPVAVRSSPMEHSCCTPVNMQTNVHVVWY